jgi:hypothetical protein
MVEDGLTGHGRHGAAILPQVEAVEQLGSGGDLLPLDYGSDRRRARSG